MLSISVTIDVMTERASRTSFTFRFTARQRFGSDQKDRGFTIVELLVVVVVIAILGAITFVSFNGVRKSALEAGVKSELSSATKGFEVEQLSNGGTYDPTSSAYLLKETTNTTIEYSYGNTQYFCMTGRANNDTSVIYHVINSEGDSSIQSGLCPNASFRTSYRCVAGNVVSVHSLTNTMTYDVSLKMAHSINGDVQDFSFTPGQTRSGVYSLRTSSVPRGLISFNVFNAAGTSLIETYYQTSPAVTC